MKTRVTITLIVEGRRGAVEQAIENELDAGTLQDAVNGYDDGPLEVVSALADFAEHKPRATMPRHVTWEVDVDATDDRDAAEQGRAMQLDPDSIATVFLVRDPETDSARVVDLAPPCIEWDEEPEQ